MSSFQRWKGKKESTLSHIAGKKKKRGRVIVHVVFGVGKGKVSLRREKKRRRKVPDSSEKKKRGRGEFSTSKTGEPIEKKRKKRR